jgi:hypothetical protein
MESLGSLDLKHDPNESTNIGWFSKEELEKVDTLEDIKREMMIAMDIHEKIYHN